MNILSLIWISDQFHFYSKFFNFLPGTPLFHSWVNRVLLSFSFRTITMLVMFEWVRVLDREYRLNCRWLLRQKSSERSFNLHFSLPAFFSKKIWLAIFINKILIFHLLKLISFFFFVIQSFLIAVKISNFCVCFITSVSLILTLQRHFTTTAHNFKARGEIFIKRITPFGYSIWKLQKYWKVVKIIKRKRKERKRNVEQ